MIIYSLGIKDSIYGMQITSVMLKMIGKSFFKFVNKEIPPVRRNWERDVKADLKGFLDKFICESPLCCFLSAFFLRILPPKSLRSIRGKGNQ